MKIPARTISAVRSGTGAALPVGAAPKQEEMKVLFIAGKRSKYAGSSVYAENLIKELGILVSSYELFVVSEVGDWPSALLRTIRRTQPDLVHVLSANPAKMLRVGFLLRGLRIPKVLTVHNIPPKESRIGCLYNWPRAYFFARGLRYSYGRLLLLWAIRYYSALIVPSEGVKAELEEFSGGFVYKVPEGMSFGNASWNKRDGGSSLRRRRGEERKPIILTVAAFIFHKGIHQVLDALPKIIREYPGLQYVVAGKKRDPAYLRHLRARVLAKGLDDHVQFLPDADAETLAALYENCDVYIQPSYEEGFCLTFLEALSIKQGLRKPFVLTGGAAGEIPTLMDLAGMGDFVFDAKRVSSLEEKLLLALRAARNGFSPLMQWQRIVETYSWEKAAAETYKVYELATGRYTVRNLVACRNDAFGSDL